jgi:polyhydroxyalkanoate synthesis repressor PhaR
MQTVKKYANRKLYHVDRKRYITLDGIAALIQSGEQVRVIDNESGEDITAPILAQVALQGRGERGWLPANVLAGLIRTGEGTLGGLQRSLLATLGGNAVDAEITTRLERLRATGALSDEEHARLHTLLLQHPAENAESGSARPAPFDLPSRRDLDRLRAEVEGLAEAIEKLASERGA